MQLNVPVDPSGQVVTLSVNLPTGATIYNDHDAQTVYVSTQPIAGGGIPVKPKSSITWTADGQAAYAVNPGPAHVSLLVTDEAGDVASPLDIAVATASRLAATGIPSVMLNQLVYDGPVESTGAWGMRVPVRLDGYASVTVMISKDQLTGDVFRFQWRNSKGNNASGEPTYTTGPVYEYQVTTNSAAILTMPVMGEWLFINDSCRMQVVGTNRTLPYADALQSQSGRYDRVAPWTANTKYDLNGRSTNYNGDYWSHSGGDIMMRSFVASSGGVQLKGTFGVYLSGGVALELFETNEMAAHPKGTGVSSTKVVSLPPGCFKWWFEPTNSFTGNVRCEMTVVNARY